MSSLTGRLGLLCVTVGLFAANAAAQQTPTFEMRIVRVNNTTYSPFVTTVQANPGSLVYVDVFASEWSPGSPPEALRSWQVSLDGVSLESGLRGMVAPKRGKRACAGALDCLDLGRSCGGDFTCGGLATNYEAGFVVNKLRADWIYAGRGDLLAVDASTPAVRMGSVLLTPSESPTYGPTGDINAPAYVGTFIFEVSSLACGDFDITLLPTPDTKMVNNRNDLPLILPLEIRGITIRTIPSASCACTQIEVVDGSKVTDPLDCWVDSRQPTDPDGTNAANLRTIDVKFNCPNSASVAADVDSFSLLEDGVPSVRGISSIDANTPDAGWVRVHLRNPIAAGMWSCLSYSISGQEVCVGSLPGDADQSLDTDASADLSKLIACIQAQLPCALNACDMDRSGRCSPGDVLRAIDLFNGGDFYDIWDGASLPACQ